MADTGRPATYMGQNMTPLEFALFWFLIPAGALAWTVIVIGGYIVITYLQSSHADH